MNPEVLLAGSLAQLHHWSIFRIAFAHKADALPEMLIFVVSLTEIYFPGSQYLGAECYNLTEMSELLGLPVDIVVTNSLIKEKDCFSWRLVMENEKGGMKKQLKNLISGMSLSPLRNPVWISQHTEKKNKKQNKKQN